MDNTVPVMKEKILKGNYRFLSSLHQFIILANLFWNLWFCNTNSLLDKEENISLDKALPEYETGRLIVGTSAKPFFYFLCAKLAIPRDRNY